MAGAGGLIGRDPEAQAFALGTLGVEDAHTAFAGTVLTDFGFDSLMLEHEDFFAGQGPLSGPPLPVEEIELDKANSDANYG